MSTFTYLHIISEAKLGFVLSCSLCRPLTIRHIKLCFGWLWMWWCCMCKYKNIEWKSHIYIRYKHRRNFPPNGSFHFSLSLSCRLQSNTSFGHPIVFRVWPFEQLCPPTPEVKRSCMIMFIECLIVKTTKWRCIYC